MTGYTHWLLEPLTGEAYLPHDGFGRHVCTVEQRIPIGQQGITFSDSLSDEPGVFLPKQPGFPSLGVHGRMATKEGLVGSGLVPTHKQLCLWISDEATYIS